MTNPTISFVPPHHGSHRKSIRNTDRAFHFEERVKSWLEQLRSSPSDYHAVFPEEAREALVDYVVPALSDGVVRAGGPREAMIEYR